MTRHDPRRSPRRLLLLAVAVLALAGLAVGAALNGTLAYARTPAQLLADPATSGGRSVRLTGVVVPGTLRRDGGTARFELRDDGSGSAQDARTVPVRAQDAPPQALREGAQAVVEGTLQPDGVFLARQVIAKHSNVYRARS